MTTQGEISAEEYKAQLRRDEELNALFDSYEQEFFMKGYATALEDAAREIEPWLDTETMKLRAGEMSAQEVRTVKAVVTSILAAIRSLKQGG